MSILKKKKRTGNFSTFIEASCRRKISKKICNVSENLLQISLLTSLLKYLTPESSIATFCVMVW